MEEAIEVAAEVIEPAAELAATCSPAPIEDNLAAVEAWVDAQVAPYLGVVVDFADRERRAEARRAMADLNKIKAPIEEERKRVRREYEAPLKAFEARVRAITAKIDGARAEIRAQYDAGEAEFRAAREAALQAEYEAVAGPVAGMIPLSALMEPEWLQPSKPEGWACAKLADRAADALASYEQVASLDMEFKDEALAEFCRTLDAGAAIARSQALAEERRRMEEFRAAQEALRPPEPEPSPTPEPSLAPEPVWAWSLSMEFEATRAQAQRVADALHAEGVTGATMRCLGEVRRG